MTRSRLAFIGATLALGLVACDSSDDPVDSGAATDTGTATDGAAPTDGDVPTDSDVPADADVPTDSGVVTDSAMTGDATTAAVGCEGMPATDLCFLREEEKLARDVYITLYESSGMRVFDSISRSEQSHTDAVRDLMAARGITDPVTDDTVGVFVNSVLDSLYTDLTTSGLMGDTEALLVGATIEDLDIHDIEEMEARTTDAEILAMYDVLKCGSRNHMRSFISQLDRAGETYTPVYISSAAFEAIIGSPRESCGG